MESVYSSVTVHVVPCVTLTLTGDQTLYKVMLTKLRVRAAESTHATASISVCVFRMPQSRERFLYDYVFSTFFIKDKLMSYWNVNVVVLFVPGTQQS
jgi:hypothetical protein